MLFEFKIVDKDIYNMNTKEVLKENIKNKCIFYFDEQTYKGKTLFVTFVNKFGYTRTIILGKWRKSLSCEIPLSMLKNEYFNFFCHTKDLYRTKTIKVFNTAALTDVNLLIKKLDKKIDNILYEDKQLKCYSNNILVGTVPMEYTDEETIQKIINDNLALFKENLNEQLEDFITEDDLEYLIISL